MGLCEDYQVTRSEKHIDSVIHRSWANNVSLDSLPLSLEAWLGSSLQVTPIVLGALLPEHSDLQQDRVLVLPCHLMCSQRST